MYLVKRFHFKNTADFSVRTILLFQKSELSSLSFLWKRKTWGIFSQTRWAREAGWITATVTLFPSTFSYRVYSKTLPTFSSRERFLGLVWGWGGGGGGCHFCRNRHVYFFVLFLYKLLVKNGVVYSYDHSEVFVTQVSLILNETLARLGYSS